MGNIIFSSDIITVLEAAVTPRSVTSGYDAINVMDHTRLKRRFRADDVLADDAKKAELAALVAPAKAIFLDAKIESELIDLDPEDAAAHVALLALDEREGKTWEPLSAVEGIAEELQVRAANDEDPLALAILQRDWDARNVIVEAEHEGQENAG